MEKVFQTIERIYDVKYSKEKSADFLSGFKTCYVLFQIGYRKSITHATAIKLDKCEEKLKATEKLLDKTQQRFARKREDGSKIIREYRERHKNIVAKLEKQVAQLEKDNKELQNQEKIHIKAYQQTVSKNQLEANKKEITELKKQLEQYAPYTTAKLEHLLSLKNEELTVEKQMREIEQKKKHLEKLEKTYEKLKNHIPVSNLEVLEANISQSILKKLIKRHIHTLLFSDLPDEEKIKTLQEVARRWDFK